MNILAQIDALLASGGAHTVFIGRSVVPGSPRFVTFRTGAGVTIAAGRGQTAAEALVDALQHVSVRPMPAVVTQPAMPMMTRTMPSVKKE